MHLLLFLYALLLYLTLRLTTSIYTALTSPLTRLPGPWPTRFTKLWFFNRVRKGRFEHENIALHRRYGAVVRVAPGWYSLDDPGALKVVYGIGTRFEKSEWYEGWKQ